MSQIPAPSAIARKHEQKSAKDVETALDVLRLAVENAKGRGLTATEVCKDAERLWEWVQSDTWPPPKAAT